MLQRTFVFAALCLTAAVAMAAPLAESSSPRPVPAIPHGLDWSILQPPNPQVPAALLSEDQLRAILPPLIRLGRADGVVVLRAANRARDNALIGPFVGLITGAAVLLAAYGFIPMVQTQLLRIRSVHLNRDLFS